MVESRTIESPPDLTPHMVSADAWAAVRVLAVLAACPATGGEIEDRIALDTLTVLPLLKILECEGLVYRTRDGSYALAEPAAAISIAAIVRAVDGDGLGRASDADEAPEIAEIQRRIAVMAADVLDNFSLAEAVENGLSVRGHGMGPALI